MRAALVTLTVCLLVLPASAKYSGGTGEPNDPYQIATAADLIALGETPEDYDKHFILTADIDLDPNLPGGKVFTEAVIAPVRDSWGRNHDYHLVGDLFAGVFDGDDHVVSHLRIDGCEYVGLFGYLARGAQVRNLGVVDACILSSGGPTGGLAACNAGEVRQCYSTCVIRAVGYTGGFIGRNAGSVIECYSDGRLDAVFSVGGLVGHNQGQVTLCHSTAAVSAEMGIGGLVGQNEASVLQCYSTGGINAAGWCVGGLIGWNTGTVARCYRTDTVSGRNQVGGLVGRNEGAIGQSYCTGAVQGESRVGGLVAWNIDGAVTHGTVTQCYSTGLVSGVSYVGGLVGTGYAGATGQSFWDTETSGQAASDGGTGLTTAQMQNIQAFLDAGWDFVGEITDGTSQIWRMPEPGGYPTLAVFNGYVPPELQGLGTAEDPYLISDPVGLGAMVYYSPYAHYRLGASIDLSGIRWGAAVIPWFAGSFDGNGFTISHLTITGQNDLALFGRLESGGSISNLRVVDASISGSGNRAGVLVGSEYRATMYRCRTSGAVSGNASVGGLVGAEYEGHVSQGCSAGTVRGSSFVGGFAGECSGQISQCYSTGAVAGDWRVAGLVADIWAGGAVSQCYSIGLVTGNSEAGGLVGRGSTHAVASFWDTQTSGQATSDGGTGKTTADMQIASTFTDAGWDFVGETVNGTDDIWWIDEGKDYPHLWWELIPGN
jgi:hypothetical protein